MVTDFYGQSPPRFVEISSNDPSLFATKADTTTMVILAATVNER